MITDVKIVNSGFDRDIAVKIAGGLHSRGINVWIDPESVMSGSTSVESVKESVRNCRIVIYIVSSATNRIEWKSEMRVMEEVAREQFIRNVGKAGPIVLPVCVNKIQPSSRIEFEGYCHISQANLEYDLDVFAGMLRRELDKRKIFICHSSTDKQEVQSIVDRLNSEEALDVWYDNDSLQPGAIIRRGIESGIASADYLIVVLSKNVIDTLDGWIGFELDQAYEIERGRNKNGHYFAIPVLIEPDLKIPGWLSTKVYVDLTKGFDDGMNHLINALREPIILSSPKE